MAVTDDDTEGKSLVQRKMQKKSLFSRENAIFPSKKAIFRSEKPKKGLKTSSENQSHAEKLYMDNSSFRDILARFLEENSTNLAREPETKTFQPEPTPLLHWENPNLKQIPRDFRSTGYPAPAPRKIVP